MKIKSIVLTAALATAFSAFSDTVPAYAYDDWFTTSPDNVRYFDTEIDSPVRVENFVSVPSGWTIASYAITAHVTNLVVFAEVPSTTPTTISAKDARGAICAAAGKWYGLKYVDQTADWDQLTSVADPQEGHSYKFRMDFANNGNTVTYSVNDLADNSVAVSEQQLNTKVTTTSNALPNLYAFAGMGGCTNIVGEIVVAVTQTSVEDADVISIRVPNDAVYESVRETPNEIPTGGNGLKNWVNYVLGIDGSVANNKPFAAPVQNSEASKLTFKLGGAEVRSEKVTGAKVTYTVKECGTPNGTFTSAVNDEYKDSDDSFEINTPNSVKYYRIEIKIESAE